MNNIIRDRILPELYAERTRLDEAIRCLESGGTRHSRKHGQLRSAIRAAIGSGATTKAEVLKALHAQFPGSPRTPRETVNRYLRQGWLREVGGRLEVAERVEKSA